MFKSFGLKPSALSEVFHELSTATLEAERERGDVEFNLRLSGSLLYDYIINIYKTQKGGIP